MLAFIDSHRTTQGTGGEMGIIPEHLVEDMPLLGLFFLPSSCLTTPATQALSRVFCNAATVYAHYGSPCLFVCLLVWFTGSGSRKSVALLGEEPTLPELEALGPLFCESYPSI